MMSPLESPEDSRLVKNSSVGWEQQQQQQQQQEEEGDDDDEDENEDEENWTFFSCPVFLATCAGRLASTICRSVIWYCF